MAWLSRPRPSQSQETRSRTEEPQHLRTALAERTIGAPRDYHDRGPFRSVNDVIVVPRSDRIARTLELTTVRRAKGEEVHDLHPAVTPVASEADAAPDCRVV